MSYLIVNDLSKYFGGTPIITNASFQIGPAERVALVGPNGAGKTTLLNVIAGHLEADGGSIHIARSASMVFISQDVGLPQAGETVFDTMLLGAENLLQMRDQLRNYEVQMSQSETIDNKQAMDNVMEKYDRLLQSYTLAGGYELETLIKTILTGLGLAESTWDNNVSILSGGQKVRLALALALLKAPDLLLLDEPTNHLDLGAIEWLEQWLGKFKGAVLFVSHDRYFIDKVATHSLVMEDGNISLYKGNYTQSMGQRSLEVKTASTQYKENIKKAEQLQTLIQKNKAKASKASHAKSWEKKLARLNLNKPATKTSHIKLQFTALERGGDEIYSFEDIGHGYGDKLLFKGFNAAIRRGDHIVLLGPNGCGKTTLLRIIMGAIEPQWGTVHRGKSIKVGYFDQSLSQLEEKGTILEQVMEWGGMLPAPARNFLAKFLFTGDDVFKKAEVLSGGERNRLMLARLILAQSNVLILDEPTNHLDLQSREILENALQDFPGTIIFVTHDRYLMQQLGRRFWSFEEQKIEDFTGTYEEFVRWRDGLKHVVVPKSRPQQEMREKNKDIIQEENSILELERQITQLEEEIEALETMFSSQADYSDPQTVDAAKRHQNINKKLSELYATWEKSLKG